MAGWRKAVEAGDEAVLDGIVAGCEHDRDRRSGCLGCPRCRRTASEDHGHLSAHQFGCEDWQLAVLTCPAEIDRQILAFI